MPTPATARRAKPRSEDEFEDIVADFLRLRWSDPNAQRFGRRGQRQYGIDVLGRPPRLGGASAGGQAKNVDALTLADVVAEVTKAISFPGGLKEFYIVTSGDRDARLTSAVRKRFPARRARFIVEIVFWDDIVNELARDAALVAKHWGGFDVDATNRTSVLERGKTVINPRTLALDAHRLQSLARLRESYGDLLAHAVRLSLFIQAEIGVFCESKNKRVRDEFYDRAVELEDALYPVADRITMFDFDEERRHTVDDMLNAFRDVCAPGQFYKQTLSDDYARHWTDLVSAAVLRFRDQIVASLGAEEARFTETSRAAL